MLALFCIIVSDRIGDDCVPVLLASQWIDRWGHLPVCPRRTRHLISKEFLLFFGLSFSYMILCTVLYTKRATKMSMSERRINEKEDDFFPIEHFEILDRK